MSNLECEHDGSAMERNVLRDRSPLLPGASFSRHSPVTTTKAAALAIRPDLFHILASFSETLSDSFEVSDVLYGLSDNTVAVLGAGAAGVSIMDAEGEMQFVSANRHDAIELERVQQELKQGPCYQAFRTGETEIVRDLETTDQFPEYRIKALELGFRAVLGVPLAAAGRTIGALNVYNEAPRDWTDDDIEAARILANIATSFVVHASRLGEAERLNAQLQQALDSRIVIEQAKGIIAGEAGIGLDAAFSLLRQHARHRQAPIRQVAEAVIHLGLRPADPD